MYEGAFEQGDTLIDKFLALEEDIIKLLDVICIMEKEIKQMTEYNNKKISELQHKEEILKEFIKKVVKEEEIGKREANELIKKSKNEDFNNVYNNYINSIKAETERNFYDKDLLQFKKKKEENSTKHTIDIIRVFIK